MDSVYLSDFSPNSISVVLINELVLRASVENFIWKLFVTHKCPNS